MKRFFAIFLVIIAILALTACGKDEPVDMTTTAPTTAPVTQPTTAPTTVPTTESTAPTFANDKYDPVACWDVEGLWSHELVLDGSLLSLKDFEGSVPMQMRWHFMDNGEFALGIHQLDTQIAAYEALLESYMFTNYYNRFVGECKLQNMKDDEIEAAWQGANQEKAQADAKAFVQSLSLHARYSRLERSGDYYVENDKLYLSKSDGTYEAISFHRTDAQTLTLLESDDIASYITLDIQFPMALTQV